MSLEEIAATVEKAMMNWNGEAAACSYFQLLADPPGRGEAGYDGKNVIKFRTDRWCARGDCNDLKSIYSTDAIALTTVFYNDRPGQPDDGQILDTDIELNSINYTFVLAPSSAPQPRPVTGRFADLENTLTHELGHVQGLDHTCKDSATPNNAVDESGNPPPDCGVIARLGYNNPQDPVYLHIATATMYNSNYTASGIETIKRMPKADDVAGLCSIYPQTAAPPACARAILPPRGGCSVAAGDGGTPGAVLLVALLVIWRTRRMKRQDAKNAKASAAR